MSQHKPKRWTGKLKLNRFPMMGKLGPSTAEGLAKLVASLWSGSLTVFVPGLVLASEANQREHHMAKYKRKVRQQKAVEAALVGRPAPPGGKRLQVTFTREYAGQGKPMDTDNLAGSFKHVQDQTAKFLGRDDGDGTVLWFYQQLRSKTPGLGIFIEEQP